MSMTAEMFVRLIDTFGGRSWVLADLLKVYESGDQDAINHLESALRFFAKKIPELEEAANVG